ncbi:hypothetical protein BDN72DRAFT_865541, partial [Pluteus cervinus]
MTSQVPNWHHPIIYRACGDTKGQYMRQEFVVRLIIPCPKLQITKEASVFSSLHWEVAATAVQAVDSASVLPGYRQQLTENSVARGSPTQPKVIDSCDTPVSKRTLVCDVNNGWDTENRLWPIFPRSQNHSDLACNSFVVIKIVPKETTFIMELYAPVQRLPLQELVEARAELKGSWKEGKGTSVAPNPRTCDGLLPKRLGASRTPNLSGLDLTPDESAAAEPAGEFDRKKILMNLQLFGPASQCSRSAYMWLSVDEKIKETQGDDKEKFEWLYAHPDGPECLMTQDQARNTHSL